MAFKKDDKRGKDVAVLDTGPSNVPAYLRDYIGPLGTDMINPADVAIPRAKVGQGTSAEVKDRTNDLNEGDIFLNIDGTLLAKAGDSVPVVIVAHTTEYMLWADLKAGGGIMARARRTSLPNGAFIHEWDKPDQEFSTKLGGMVDVTWKTGKSVETDGLAAWGTANVADKDSPPAAQKHLNFVAYLPTFDMVVAMSWSRTYTAGAENLLGTLKMGNTPMFSRVFNMRTVDKHDATNAWKVVKFTPAGHVDEAMFKKTKALYEQFAEKGFEVDQSDEDHGSPSPSDDGSASQDKSVEL